LRKDLLKEISLCEAEASDLAGRLRGLTDGLAEVGQRLQVLAGVAAVSESGKPTEGWR
jgi:hypothetical protein